MVSDLLVCEEELKLVLVVIVFEDDGVEVN